MQKLSWIYFYHRRRIERADSCDHEEIPLQIFKIQGWMKEDLMQMKETDLLTPEAIAKSTIADADLKEYGLLESTETFKKNKNSNINSFHEIGWIDPFPPKVPIPIK